MNRGITVILGAGVLSVLMWLLWPTDFVEKQEKGSGIHNSGIPKQSRLTGGAVRPGAAGEAAHPPASAASGPLAGPFSGLTEDDKARIEHRLGELREELSNLEKKRVTNAISVFVEQKHQEISKVVIKAPEASELELVRQFIAARASSLAGNIHGSFLVDAGRLAEEYMKYESKYRVLIHIAGKNLTKYSVTDTDDPASISVNERGGISGAQPEASDWFDQQGDPDKRYRHLIAVDKM